MLRRLASAARLSAGVLRRPGGARQLVALAVHRAARPSFADLPLAARVDLAYEIVLRRDPTPEEAQTALERLRAGTLDHDRFLDDLLTSYADLPVDVAVRLGYLLLLRREPDREGMEIVLGRFAEGEWDRFDFLDWLRGSGDFTMLGFGSLGPSLHASRSQFVRTLPRAQRILDLGGTDLGHAEGAFVWMGYPYDFEELVLVDLHPDERHPLYRRPDLHATVQTARGPVRYAYHSMTDLSRYETASFDLVYSGQTFEHVTEADGDLVLKEVHRVLRPGGAFALDTPNARVCRLQQDELIDPDHDVEYTRDQLEAKLAAAGFTVHQRFGLNYGGRAVCVGRFSAEETARNYGLFAEIDDCYLLAYVCRPA